MVEDNIKDSWEQILNPVKLRTNLISSAMYIVGYEILKQRIVKKLKDFYTTGFDQNGDIVDPDYAKEVLKKNKSPVYASLIWLKESGAITEKDIEEFQKIKDYRNTLTHDIHRTMRDGITLGFKVRFDGMVNLINTIGKWWIVNVEIATDPDLVGKDISTEGIMPGSIMTLKLLLDVALGDDTEAWFYHREFMKHYGEKKGN